MKKGLWVRDKVLLYLFHLQSCITEKSVKRPLPGGGEKGGGYSSKFHTGRLHPEIQPLTLLDTILTEKGPPFAYLVRSIASLL